MKTHYMLGRKRGPDTRVSQMLNQKKGLFKGLREKMEKRNLAIKSERESHVSKSFQVKNEEAAKAGPEKSKVGVGRRVTSERKVVPRNPGAQEQGAGAEQAGQGAETQAEARHAPVFGKKAGEWEQETGVQKEIARVAECQAQNVQTEKIRAPVGPVEGGPQSPAQ